MGAAHVTQEGRRRWDSKDRPVAAVVESILLMRALWSGARVGLDEFPVLSAALACRPGAVAELTYPVARAPQIVVAGVGPRILAVAGACADGLISPSNLPTLSRAVLLSGAFAEISGLDRARAARPPEMPPLRLIFGINVSVSAPLGPDPAEAADLLVTAVVPALWPGRGARR